MPDTNAALTPSSYFSPFCLYPTKQPLSMRRTHIMLIRIRRIWPLAPPVRVIAAINMPSLLAKIAAAAVESALATVMG